MKKIYTGKSSSSNFIKLFHESRIQAIREQSVAQFSNILENHAGITLKNSVIYELKIVVKGFNN